VIAILIAAMASASTEKVDHTGDIAVVAEFLAHVRAGDADGAGIEVVNYQQPSMANFPAFAAYANGCRIKSITAVPNATQHLPVAVRWDCGRYTKVEGKPVWEEREAGFWVRDGRVAKLTFDAGPTIVVPPIKAKSHG
jgi:hypothetical protein